MIKRILLVPSVRKGNGTGHLVRCFSLARLLGPQAWVFIDENPGSTDRTHAEIALSYPNETASIRVLTSMEGAGNFDLVVLDLRNTSLDRLEYWAGFGPVLSIDEGGPARYHAEYVLDILPSFGKTQESHAANLACSGFIELPKRKREPSQKIETVLVSFGGEDPKGLGKAFVETAIKGSFFSADSISLLQGPLNLKTGEIPGVKILPPIQNLKERLADYDLVVCSFGLTAFEARAAGCAVITLNPSRQHEVLAQKAGFAVLKKGPRMLTTLERFIKSPALLRKSQQPDTIYPLHEFIHGLEAQNAMACPVCRQRVGQVIARYEKKSYIKCTNCSHIRMAGFFKKSDPYSNEAYFFDEYKAQYGKTYIEDFPALRAMGKRRLTIIEKILFNKKKQESSTIFDIGCAYGAFLLEAQRAGWNASGTDISPHAVNWVQSELGIPSFVSDFASVNASGFYPQNLDSLTMWYVIEHFIGLNLILNRAHSMLKTGGVFAFSTPSSSGVSGIFSAQKFWKESPDDHFSVFSPKTVRRILKTWGFTVKKIVITGHHPERFPLFKAREGSFGYRILMVISRLFGLGDTFECYAVKDTKPSKYQEPFI